MRIRRSVHGLFAMILVALCLTAQDRPASGAQGLSLLQQSLALSGLSAGSLQTLSVAGTFTRAEVETGATVPFRVRALGSDRVRWEFDYPEGTVTSVARRGGGWRASSRGGGQLSLGQVSGRTLEYFPSLALAMWLSAPSTVAAFQGTELTDGVLQHKIEVRRAYPGQTDADFGRAFEQVTRCEVYLDANTLRVVRLRYFDHSRDWRRGIPMDLYFSDYQVVGGVLMPLTVTRQIGARKASELHITSVVLNTAVSDSEFVEVRR